MTQITCPECGVTGTLVIGKSGENIFNFATEEDLKAECPHLAKGEHGCPTLAKATTRAILAASGDL
jgi:hypothetical protein